MTAKTVALTHTHRQPSRLALAARSLTAVERLAGEAKHVALAQHFEQFPPAAASVCPLR